MDGRVGAAFAARREGKAPLRIPYKRKEKTELIYMVKGLEKSYPQLRLVIANEFTLTMCFHREPCDLIILQGLELAKLGKDSSPHGTAFSVGTEPGSFGVPLQFQGVL